MRVAFLITGLTHAETQVVRIAAGLARRGHRTAIIALRPLVGAGANDGDAVPITSLNIRSRFPDPVGIRRLYTRLREFQRGVLVTFGVDATLFGRVVAPLAGVHCVVSALRPEADSSALQQMVLRATDPLSRVTVASAPRIAADLADRRIVSPHRLRIIADAGPVVADTTPDPAFRRLLNIGAGEFVWLTIGELTAASEYGTLLDACARLDDLVDNWRLLVAGEGPLRAEVESRRDRLGLSHRVFLLGFRGDTDRLLRVADAFVTSSTRDGWPDTLVAAMAAERPCLAAAVGGVPDLIENGVTGWTIPPRRPDRLCDRMHSIMQLSPGQRQAIATAARASTTTPAFDVHRVIDDWEDLLTEAVRSLPRSPAPSILTTDAGRAGYGTTTRNG